MGTFSEHGGNIMRMKLELGNVEHEALFQNT
jgi:hypothetical protein